MDGTYTSLTSSLIEFAIKVIESLPESPFVFLDEYTAPAGVVMSYVNWFIDVEKIINIFISWIACIAIWYGYQTVLRWVKVIG